MTRGGHREGAGRKQLPEGQKRKLVNFKLNPQEAEQVREFIKVIRKDKSE